MSIPKETQGQYKEYTVKYATTTSLFLSLFLLASCGDTVQNSTCTVTENDDGSATISCDDGSEATVHDGQDGEDGADCAIPPETLMMQMWWTEAEMFRRDRGNIIENKRKLCYETAQTDEEHKICEDEYQDDQVRYTAYYTRQVNVMSLRACGIAIFLDIVTDPEDYDPENNPDKHLYEINYDDEDGDGITTWWEFQMGYNPCTPQSFGCINDADLDYDGDGIVNSEDEGPICNFDYYDPNSWGADCI